jgi:hypothetical protein
LGENRRYEVLWANDGFAILLPTFCDATMKDRSWPIPIPGPEWRIPTQLGHSSSLTLTSAMGSQSGRSIAAIS